MTKIAELKVRAFDLMAAKQRIEAELQQINIALFKLEQSESVGPKAGEIPGGPDGSGN